MLKIPPGPFDAYIFDCDGTLVDSMPLHHHAWRESLRQSGASFEFDWDLFVSRAGMGLPETVLALNAQFQTRLVPAAVVALQREIFSSLIPTVARLEHVVEVARQARGHLPMAVCSGGEREVVLAELQAVGIADWFEVVVCRQDVLRGKPAPDSFLECASRLSVNPQRCLVFEDGVLGIEAARSAGMQVVVVD